GAGTLEEVFDMVMLGQLGRHAKPAAFLDSAFWGPLETLLRHVVDTGFADAKILRGLSFHGGIEDALATLDQALAAEGAA
ncbi:MAG: LOG family protein, partial [Oceanicaulis sp.]